MPRRYRSRNLLRPERNCEERLSRAKLLLRIPQAPTARADPAIGSRLSSCSCLARQPSSSPTRSLRRSTSRTACCPAARIACRSTLRASEANALDTGGADTAMAARCGLAATPGDETSGWWRAAKKGISLAANRLYLRDVIINRKEVIQCLIVIRRVWRMSRPGPVLLPRCAPPKSRG